MNDQDPLMTKELRKAIYARSKLKNKDNKNPIDENEATLKCISTT